MEPPESIEVPPATLPELQQQKADLHAAIDQQSEYHGDYTTVTISKPCPRGHTLKVVAHLGLPGGALKHLQECKEFCAACIAILSKCDFSTKSKLTARMADLYSKLADLKTLLDQFEAELRVPDGALSPSLRSVFIIVEKFLKTLRSHLAPILGTFYYPKLGLGMGPRQRSKLHIDCQKMYGILTLLRYSFNIHCQVTKDNRICPFLLGEERSGFNIEEYANSIDIFPFLFSINKHYQRLLRIAYMGLLKATAAAMHASRHPVGAYGGFIFSMYNVYYFMFSRKAAAKCVEYFKEEDFCSGRFLWNLPESIVVKFFLQKTFKRVKFYKLFDIPFEEDDPEAAAAAKNEVIKAESESDVKLLSTQTVPNTNGATPIQVDPEKRDEPQTTPPTTTHNTTPSTTNHNTNSTPPPTNHNINSTQDTNSGNNNSNGNRNGNASLGSHDEVSTSSFASGSDVTGASSNSQSPPVSSKNTPLSPGGTIDTSDSVVREKDNRTRWVTAQLVHEVVDVKIPCLPQSYLEKKIPVRMRIIFTRSIKNQAFKLQDKQKWYTDKKYSIATLDPEPPLAGPEAPYSSSSSSSLSSSSDAIRANHATVDPNGVPASSSASLSSSALLTTPAPQHNNNTETSSHPTPSHRTSHHVHIVDPNIRKSDEINTKPKEMNTKTNETNIKTNEMNGKSSTPKPTPSQPKRRMSIFRSAPKDNANMLSSALIVYYHGGGFIAMTSFSHEMYTRKWAVDTGVPILAVDYSLAPEEIYPVQTAECFHAYKWALKNHKKIGSTAEKIILIGDSAGGNLVMGVLNRTILEGVRVPDAVVLAYPALLLQPTPSLSRLCSVIDPLLNMQVLLYVLRQYATKEYIDVNDPILSPALATDEVLMRYPPVRLIVGDMDPLLDDSIFMYKRLKALNKDVEISIQDGFGHGFFNFVGIIPQIHKMLDLVAIWLLEFIDDIPAERVLAEAKQNVE